MIPVVQLIAVAVACIGVIVAVWVGISDDRSEAAAIQEDLALLVNGRPFHRIPLRNSHRLRGRHRARAA
ncbi:hypothetical protein [Nocardia seriolae]|uniref:Uncharacterized protein n=1 Tax=Nocardia seriolae TaxID=37332 RepID=A0A0B8NNN8_9NOCA|nr:hypothetical protein [Nocardia seriolae]GEM28988.1 hypothetical protein NS2_72270 [Nocardia seriolae NBRC 15557]APB01338.1 hypothetical protein NS506_07318 [Nocardia seriolae]MTK39141.1 hypothetical protein [Nocardia seriolae]QOW31211.1 hypothetical protein IMZ23_24245 [Nocardia seriolae]QUN18826.1 hypothetical protein KEC46_05340 [Nocardia seriolae]